MPEIWQDAIRALDARIQTEFAFSTHICGEIECVFEGLERFEDADDFWRPVIAACEAADIGFDSIAQEEHAGQYEFRLKPAAPLQAAQAIEALCACVMAVAAQHGVSCRFEAGEAPPYCGLHLHVHLANAQGINVFLKQEDEMTPPLRYALGGLLATMREAMCCFAPDVPSYARIAAGADHVPQTVSWGGNNRSVALRLPESVVPVRHIEHRVAGADACPYAAIWAVLAGIHYGLMHQSEPGAQMYGRASDAVYDLPRLPECYEDALALWEQAEHLADYRESFSAA